MIMANKKSRSLLSCILAAAMLFLLSACGNDDNGRNASVSDVQEDSPATEDGGIDTSDIADTGGAEDEAKSAADTGSSAKEEGSKILIAYFTAAENSGVDAIASASYTMIRDEAVGRVRAVADMIQARTGGELFSIQTSTVYPADGGALIDQAADEQNAEFRPELTSHIDNLDDYDVIFVGFPNWWYDMPMAMYSFFEEYDFTGKTIVPFNVHNGSRFSGTISTIQDLEPGAVVIEDGFTVSERNVEEAESDVQEWLAGLGY